MTFLIDQHTQTQIAALIDRAVEQVLGEIASHGNEEALTSALGHALMQQRIHGANLRVDFKYRQHNKHTEESHSGADGGFLVRIKTPIGTVEKASLFQAKLLGGGQDVRSLAMSKKDAIRLQKQSKDMLSHTEEAVAVFYTHKNIYVVDAGDYSGTLPSKTPLSQEHRLITLGTYLGRWMPRCTKGDIDPNFVKRARHVDGFRNGLSLDIVSQRPSVPWEHDQAEHAWRNKR
ncbi:hypothetical protein [Janthinobacterium sp. HH104]|uniref:hypothetical protein n=1 Tax=Janthinobacterium sp. HH104 TaxID=1537276 RepID=UPI00111308E3|nr:hypothetical protein [Janthinobacterium sp. HH104]